jgi:hypothetical protein
VSFRVFHWLVNPNLHALKTLEGLLNTLFDLGPRQASVPGPQRGQSDRADPKLLDPAYKVLEALLYVFHTGRVAPVLLGGEVEDVAGLG